MERVERERRLVDPRRCSDRFEWPFTRLLSTTGTRASESAVSDERFTRNPFSSSSLSANDIAVLARTDAGRAMTSAPRQEPLLGSAWLLAQSPASPSTAADRTEVTRDTCLSFSLFKRLLDSSRRASDDAITTRLNRASALSGSAVQGRGGVMGARECEGVWRELCARWDERRRAIEFCDGVVEAERARRAGDEATAGDGEGRRRRGTLAEEKALSADWKERGRGMLDELDFKVRSTRRTTRRFFAPPPPPRLADQLTPLPSSAPLLPPLATRSVSLARATTMFP